MKNYSSLLLFLVLFSCNFGEYSAPVILEKPNFNVAFYRVDKAIFNSTDGNAIDNSSFANNPDFAEVYVEKIMRFAPLESPMLQNQIENFTADAIWNGVQLELDSVFSDTKAIEEKFSESLKRLSEILPFISVPKKVFFYNSGFNVAVYPESEFIGVGLEWFMGKESEYVSMLPPSNYPMYKKDKMIKENLVPDALRGFLLYSLYTPMADENVLNTMVFYGKVIFTLKQCSNFSEQQILNYTKEELEWANSNEANTWKRLVQEEWLFSKDRKLMTQLTNNGPFTAGFPQDSPARLGWHTGYKMVKDFANENKDKNLKFIIDASADEILKYYNQ